ncbi:branched-chain amino acid ABC transporter substrate-binding protein [Mycobacteroides abscessus subsp. massiliense]|uniref:branched-chain amino acid ABC transporter substrate-binding protein n=1 Tax=Mycobacteroides abscessus TaxID=36809 RepID=UPI000F627568|nr:branched-chain amino acid ABC transporter substrate-binding protein [Mycobacteroides abscessus]RRE03226.1 branched-chain amino acid ABC transporter substrate-binding protein [Mycobacteroides abscessus subsp. massiliense]
MRARASVFMLGAVTLALTGCHAGAQTDSSNQSNLKIVPLVQIAQDGSEVPASNTQSAADPAGDGKAQCANVSLATAGALNGPDSALGTNIRNGVQLAIDKHNAANPGCQIKLREFDTEGLPQNASNIAPQIIGDPAIVGLIGPAFSGETKSTGQIFSEAGLVSTTGSATNVTLTQQGWKTFFRGLANDGVQGPAVANYLKKTLGYQKICVVDDSTDYGSGLANAVRGTLGNDCNVSVKKGDKDFSAAVAQLKNAAPDAVYFGGYYAEAAPLVQQLRNGGVTATFVSSDGTKDVEFVKQAGDSAKDALLSCPCGPASNSFAKDYTAKFNQEPGTYSTEGYDLATILVKGIDAGKSTRAGLLDWVRNYQGQGVAREYKWNENGELTSTLIWVYKVT